MYNSNMYKWSAKQGVHDKISNDSRKSRYKTNNNDFISFIFRYFQRYI